jgi:multiple sugar transport system permease protein
MAVSVRSSDARPAAPAPFAARPPRHRRLDRRKLRQTLLALLFLAPALLVIGTFHFFPIFYAFWISLRNWGIADRGMVWFQNYSEALRTHAFWQALGTTVYFALFTVPVTMALACLIAYLLFQRVRFLGMLRTLYFLPYVASSVAAASIWLWIFSPRVGVANTIFGWFGMGHQRWVQEPRGIFLLMGSALHISVPGLLQGPSLALSCIMIMTIWQTLGFEVVIFLVGLGNIPSETYEAARIDGASERQVFFRMTLPLLGPTIFFLTIITTIYAFQTFNTIYIMSLNSNVGGAGGPLRTTQTVMIYVFNQFQVQHRLGYGSAVAFILFLLIMAMTLLQIRLSRRLVN